MVYPKAVIIRGFAAVIAIILTAGPMAGRAAAQILGPLIDNGVFELGGSLGNTHRDYEMKGVEGDTDLTENFWDGTVFFRYGVGGWVTLSGEAMLGDINTIVDSDGNERLFIFGMGAQSRVYRWRDYTISAGIHYVDKLSFSRTGEACDVRYGSITGIVQVEKRIRIASRPLAVWGGPSYQYGFEDQYASARCGEKEWRSRYNLGLSAGLDVVLIDRLRADAFVIFAGNVMPRFTLSWIF